MLEVTNNKDIQQDMRLSSLVPQEDLSELDAQALLSKALVEAAAPINDKAVQAAFFLKMYLGPEGDSIVRDALALKARQSPGTVKKIVEAIKALAALELIKPFTIASGGK